MMIVPDETRVDVRRLQDIAASLGVLFDDHAQHFEGLYGYTPELGDFEAARWLGDVVTGHRDTVLAHVAYLRRTLAEIHAALGQIADEFDETDAANAAAVACVEDPSRR
ncbi:hypothetical protein [Actinoplanes sp. NPDC089786]|uniref:hypothetical protein n=1 Tax=Actinoplanes sp. NPDC089786 TaxID=3155185 RepID=UPI003416A698